MTLWLVLAFMTATAVAIIVWPFAFKAGVVAGGSDVEVYKDQLAEIDRDRENGLIGAADAAAARVEVSRRLIRAAQDSKTSNRPSTIEDRTEFRRFITLTIALVSLPILAGSLYLRFGSPGATQARNAVEDQAASSVDDTAVGDMVSEVEGYLKTTPNDGHGWEALAPIYMRLGRYNDAIRAWNNAIANLGESADREENLGESFVAANDGTVTKEAKKAFEKALSIDPNDIAARFYTGLAAKQEGRRDEAAKIWRDLIAGATPDAEWVDTVRDALAQLNESSSAAAEDAEPSDRQATMIKSMVAGLAERLKADGRDPDGWLRLTRSYNVLGDREKADAAVADARAALAQDPEKLAQFEDGLKSASAGSTPQDSRRPVSTGATSVEHDNATMQAMVDKLAQRLKNEGGDAEGWLMLIRSYEAMGEHGSALAAIAQARLALASDPDKLSHFDQSLRAIIGAPLPDLAEKPEARKPVIADEDSAAEQMTMIKGMVNRLAERLKKDDHDVAGWTQLMRSYVVLGLQDQAVAASRRARLALGSDADALRRIDDAARELGLRMPAN